MCGFIGVFPIADACFSNSDLEPALSQMSARGPDDKGLWSDGKVLLGHRRLAILDLDARSRQPMVSSCGRYAIAYNGEIYNFRELRKQLEERGCVFKTTSDTEVLLSLFASEGESMLPRLRGMFSFVIWDRVASRGFVARDPYGIKPLYYACTPTGLLVGSQVKALLATALISRVVDPRGQAGFWLLGSVPEPHTWYRDIRALPAGSSAWISKGRLEHIRQWWDIRTAWSEVQDNRAIPAGEVRERVRKALAESVKAHLVSDVPVGVFLSGGIDSGALAALMVEAGARNVQGVTITYREFEGTAEDEAPLAARLAAHYNIKHHVRVISREEFKSDLPRILRAMDQPSIDGVNTWYASKAVGELGLKVVVSGVGGDELFQGYDSFSQLPRLVSWWRRLSYLPGVSALARGACGLAARKTGNLRWNHLPEWSHSMPGAWLLRRSLFSPNAIPELMGVESSIQGLQGLDPVAWISEMSGALPSDLALSLGQIESALYLRNQLLRDSDWASMDHSVELRTPLVDAWLLRDLKPLLAQFRGFPNKSLLSGAPKDSLPIEIVQRPKTGFGVPIGAWLRENGIQSSLGVDSREWARKLISTGLDGLNSKSNS